VSTSLENFSFFHESDCTSIPQLIPVLYSLIASGILYTFASRFLFKIKALIYNDFLYFVIQEWKQQLQWHSSSYCHSKWITICCVGPIK